MGGTTPILQSHPSSLLPFRIRKPSNIPHGPPRADARTRTSTSTVERPTGHVTRGTDGIVPIRPLTLLVLALFLSTLFTVAISFSFLGHDADEPYFKKTLDDVAQTNPGIVLLGENVDVDVDEPSIGIRWSILGCGDGYVLDGSAGAHGSDLCGLPSSYLEIYVDSSIEPTAIYDPSHLPFVSQTGRRRDIQNLVQFDSDHTLDVHLDRLYPFDNYILTSTLRAVSTSNTTIPIQKLATIDQVSSFVIESVDVETYEAVSSPTSTTTTTSGSTDGVQTTQIPTRDIDLYVSRPAQARAFTLLLFALSWFLAHATLLCVYLARKCSTYRTTRSAKPILKHLGGSLMVLLAIPQLRNAMPDAPGYDGVLIDCIGFFPQMILSSLSVLALLLLMILRELEGMEGEDRWDESSVGINVSEPPPTPYHHRATQPAKQAPPPPPPSPAAFGTDPSSHLKPWTKTESGPNSTSTPLKRLILATKRRNQTRTSSVSLERGHLLRDESDTEKGDFDTDAFLTTSTTPTPTSSSFPTTIASSFVIASRSPSPSDSEEIARPEQQQHQQQQQARTQSRRTSGTRSAFSAFGGRPGSVYRYELARSSSYRSSKRNV